MRIPEKKKLTNDVKQPSLRLENDDINSYARGNNLLKMFKSMLKLA